MPEPAATRIAELEAIIAPLADELRDLRDTAQREKNEALVGQCFKFRNCYSLPQSDADYWWLYARVVEVGEWSPVALTFAHTSKDELQAAPQTFITSTGWVEIPRAEYDAALAVFKAEVQAFGG